MFQFFLKKFSKTAAKAKNCKIFKDVLENIANEKKIIANFICHVFKGIL